VEKTQRKRVVLFPARFTNLWKSEILIELKIDADAQNRRRRRFCVRRKIDPIYQGQRRKYAGNEHASTVYAVSRIKSKTKQILPTVLPTQRNPTQSNLTYIHPMLWNYIVVCTTENTTESLSSIMNTFHNVVEKRNLYQSQNRRRRPEPTPASLWCPSYNISHLSRTAKGVCW
jgi:hypothetical protein